MTIDPNLDKVITSMQTASATAADGTVGNGLRPWFNFADVKEAGQFDFEDVMEIFSREVANTEYLTARSQDPKSKEVAVPKLTVDILAGLQRDYLARTRSRIRYFTHAAAMHAADGSGEGPLRRNSVDFVTRVSGGDYNG